MPKTHALPYRAIRPGGPLSPVVPVVLVGPSRQPIPTFALIDSGADCTSLPTAFAAQLGIDVDRCEEVSVATAAGLSRHIESPIVVTGHVDGERVRLRPVFADDLPVMLLGRRDFFSKFRVTFDERARTLTLRAYS